MTDDRKQPQGHAAPETHFWPAPPSMVMEADGECRTIQAATYERQTRARKAFSDIFGTSVASAWPKPQRPNRLWWSVRQTADVEAFEAIKAVFALLTAGGLTHPLIGTHMNFDTASGREKFRREFWARYDKAFGFAGDHAWETWCVTLWLGAPVDDPGPLRPLTSPEKQAILRGEFTDPVPEGRGEYDCGCHRCHVEQGRPVMHMILCSSCGNKRCPRATDHRLACTNSNEPGQDGSMYGRLRLDFPVVHLRHEHFQAAEEIADLTEQRTLLSEPPDLTEAELDVFAERRRQVGVEGYTPDKDDAYPHGDLARAGASYALSGARAGAFGGGQTLPPSAWPWPVRAWKPKNARADLVRAAALIIAEIERGDRVALKAKQQAEAEARAKGEAQ